MDRLWAPWRTEYIGEGNQNGSCFLCYAGETRDDRAVLVLERGDHCLTLLNKYPYTPGHILVASLRHTAELDDLGDDELLNLMLAVRRARAVLQTAGAPDAFNIGMNLGRAAGAGLKEHLHIHVVPRWEGDVNFMSVLGDIRIVSEALMQTYDKLATLYREAGGAKYGL